MSYSQEMQAILVQIVKRNPVIYAYPTDTLSLTKTVKQLEDEKVAKETAVTAAAPVAKPVAPPPPAAVPARVRRRKLVKNNATNKETIL